MTFNNGIVQNFVPRGGDSGENFVPTPGEFDENFVPTPGEFDENFVPTPGDFKSARGGGTQGTRIERSITFKQFFKKFDHAFVPYRI